MRFDRFHKADKDLTQPSPLHHLRIYLRAENATVNKVLDHYLSELKHFTSGDQLTAFVEFKDAARAK